MFTLVELCINFLVKNQYLIDYCSVPSDLIERIELFRLSITKPVYSYSLDYYYSVKSFYDEVDVRYCADSMIRIDRGSGENNPKLVTGEFISKYYNKIDKLNTPLRSKYLLTWVRLILTYIRNLSNDEKMVFTGTISRMMNQPFFRRNIDSYYERKYWKLLKEVSQITI